MRAIDPKRLARAVHLDARRLGRETFEVTGGRQRHLVTVDSGVVSCDCYDAQARPELVCKHRLAVVLLRLPSEAREALRALVQRVTGR